MLIKYYTVYCQRIDANLHLYICTSYPYEFSAWHDTSTKPLQLFLCMFAMDSAKWRADVLGVLYVLEYLLCFTFSRACVIYKLSVLTR